MIIDYFNGKLSCNSFIWFIRIFIRLVQWVLHIIHGTIYWTTLIHTSLGYIDELFLKVHFNRFIRWVYFNGLLLFNNSFKLLDVVLRLVTFFFYFRANFKSHLSQLNIKYIYFVGLLWKVTYSKFISFK